MAVISVNPTRMELTNLKKKLLTARRGHSLLKDKRDELMRQFIMLVKENLELRKKVENSLNTVNLNMARAHTIMDERAIDVSLMMPRQKVSVKTDIKNIMSVNVPVFKTEYKSLDESDLFSYGFAFTSSSLDNAVKSFSNTLPDLIRLAQVEKQCQLLSAEIERTRRRVNALEHIMIPQYEETIRYISMKLEENERSSTTRLMKVKDMMLKEAHNYK